MKNRKLFYDWTFFRFDLECLCLGSMMNTYIHGYDGREKLRLQDQADTLVELLHGDTRYPAGSLVLEAGCGVGAQTQTLVANSPGTQIVSLDISLDSLREARRMVSRSASGPVSFLQADIFHLPFPPHSFDHLFVCFVLEHLHDPVQALSRLKEVLKPGGSLTVIEGDHGSAYFYPDSDYAHRAIDCQIRLQRQAGGNALIGRELYPLLQAAGFASIRVSPRMVYVDAGKPEWVDGFTKKTFTAMIEGVRGAALSSGMIDAAAFDRGIADLYRTAEKDGVFCYTFFKAVAHPS